jgi:hypothetical protein
MESRNIALQGTVPDPGLRFCQPLRGGITMIDGLGIEAGAQFGSAERLGPRQRADRVPDGARSDASPSAFRGG